jgi:integrase
MPPIRAINEVKLPKMDVWRDGQASLAENYGDLGRMPWEKLRATEIFPGCRLDAEVLVVPEEWMPPGSRNPSRRKAVPARAGVPTETALAAKRDECVRRALYALWLPHNANSVIVESKPNTWSLRANAFLRLAEWQLANRPSLDGSVFANLLLSDVVTGFYRVAPGVESECKMALRILADAGDRKVILDYPAFFKRGQEANAAAPLEPVRRGAAALRPAERKQEPSVEPFSDEFVTEFLRRALWIQNNLADAMLDHLKRDIRIRKKYKHWSSSSKKRQKALEAWRVRTSPSACQMRYPLRLGEASEFSDAWPPPTVPSFYVAVGILQGCNLGVVNACMGARASEILAADDVDFGLQTGRYQSRTFKLVDEIGGQARDWPLHPAAERAIDIQRRLSKLLRRPGQRHLWVAMRGKKASRLNSATSVFRSTVEYLGLADLLGSGTAHMHRWRHTVARLVALSVVGAPKVLFDLFGHKDIEMTLHYMMSDPTIAEEAILVAKEMTYALAKDAVVEVLQEEPSGAAAASLRERLPTAMSLGTEAFDTKTLRETAEVLTDSGRYWSLVREGVICTKGLGQYGPCTKGRGAPDPGGCRTSCDFRFELSMAKQQCAQVLAALIRERRAADASGLEFLVENLDGQIVAELHRWPEVRENVLAEHPDINCLWEDRRK